MKKLISVLFCLFTLSGICEAKHTLVFVNATNITTGTLADARLDATSVTLQGNNFNAANQLLQLDGSAFVPNANVNPTLFNGTNTSTAVISINVAASTASVRRSASVFIGTSSSQQVDFIAGQAGAAEVAFNAAISSLGANGGDIIVRQASYTFTSAVTTVPYNVRLIAEAGTIYTSTGTGYNVFTVSGTMIGGIVRPESPFNGDFIVMRTSSILDGITFDSGTYKTGVSTAGLIFATMESNLWVRNCMFTNMGDIGSWLYLSWSSVTDSRISQCFITNSPDASSLGYLMQIYTSTNCILTDNTYLARGDAALIYAKGNSFDFKFTQNRCKSLGVITNAFVHPAAGAVSSRTVISDNEFSAGSSVGSVGVDIDGTDTSFNIVTNNNFTNFGTAGIRFLNSNQKNNFAHGNIAYSGTLFSDSGSATKFRDNYLSTWVSQTDSP